MLVMGPSLRIEGSANPLFAKPLSVERGFANMSASCRLNFDKKWTFIYVLLRVLNDLSVSISSTAFPPKQKCNPDEI